MKTAEQKLKNRQAAARWRKKQPRETFLFKQRTNAVRNREFLKINNPEEHLRRVLAERVYRNNYKKNHPDRVRLQRKKKDLKQFYGLTYEEWEAKTESQRGACFVCKQLPLEGRILHVDHDHKTGRVRELLCEFCNKGLGQFKDSPYLLRAAAEYLEFHSLAKEVLL